jgi:hypothetical protein
MVNIFLKFIIELFLFGRADRLFVYIVAKRFTYGACDTCQFGTPLQRISTGRGNVLIDPPGPAIIAILNGNGIAGFSEVCLN